MPKTVTTLAATLLVLIGIQVFVVEPLSWEPSSAPPNQKTTRDTTPNSISTKSEGLDTLQAHEESIKNTTLPVFTRETLARYDGSDASLPIYLAFDGSVYDVTPGKEFYGPGNVYHFLAGTDGTKLLSMIGGDIIREKYKVIGTFVEDGVASSSVPE